MKKLIIIFLLFPMFVFGQPLQNTLGWSKDDIFNMIFDKQNNYELPEIKPGAVDGTTDIITTGVKSGFAYRFIMSNKTWKCIFIHCVLGNRKGEDNRKTLIYGFQEVDKFKLSNYTSEGCIYFYKYSRYVEMFTVIQISNYDNDGFFMVCLYESNEPKYLL